MVYTRGIRITGLVLGLLFVHASAIAQNTNATGASLNLAQPIYWSETAQANGAGASVTAAGSFDEGGVYTNGTGATAVINPTNLLADTANTLEPSLTGRLLDADLNFPLSCAVVELIASGDTFRVTSVTDANGEYFFQQLPAGMYTLHVLAPGYVTIGPEPIQFSGQTSALVRNYALTPAVTPNTLTGRVTDAVSGAPLVGVLVSLFTGETFVVDTFTCADGRYDLPLPQAQGDLNITVEFTLANYASAERNELADPEAGIVIDQSLAALSSGTASLAGAVIAAQDENDAPIEGAQITLLGPTNTSTTTDVNGAYAFEDLLDGQYLISASAETYQGQYRVRILAPNSSTTENFALSPATDSLLGDVNNDGVVDAVDVQLVINAALGLTVGPNVEPDVNSDTTINAVDVQLVINAALGV